MDGNERLIRDLYQHFNDRRFDDAAELFAPDALLEHAPLGRQQRGGDGYREFVAMWTRAFPDAALEVRDVSSADGVTYEVELLANGTHTGAFDMGSVGVFKATGARALLRMRQLLEIRDGLVRFSSLSFDVQDIVQQLASIDAAKLLEHIQRIQQIGAKLAATPAAEIVERRSLIERIGVELDAARRVVRPHYNR